MKLNTVASFVFKHDPAQAAKNEQLQITGAQPASMRWDQALETYKDTLSLSGVRRFEPVTNMTVC